jgi:hypothetical protein
MDFASLVRLTATFAILTVLELVTIIVAFSDMLNSIQLPAFVASMAAPLVREPTPLNASAA